MGDLGAHFPDTDPRWQDVDSTVLLAEVVRMVIYGGWTVGNVDCSVVLEAPRLAPHRVAMEDRLSNLVGAPVTIKARRAEGLGALGRREGVACWAVAIVEQ
jgi:2-C-methyl-D-erythritol 2,4-cyclodiphosphate synthase